MKEIYVPQVGDHVYHRVLGETGIVTMSGMDYAHDSTSTVVEFAIGDEREVTTHFLEKI